MTPEYFKKTLVSYAECLNLVCQYVNYHASYNPLCTEWRGLDVTNWDRRVGRKDGDDLVLLDEPLFNQDDQGCQIVFHLSDLLGDWEAQVKQALDRVRDAETVKMDAETAKDYEVYQRLKAKFENT
jgi:hypothetical protein